MAHAVDRSASRSAGACSRGTAPGRASLAIGTSAAAIRAHVGLAPRQFAQTSVKSRGARRGSARHSRRRARRSRPRAAPRHARAPRAVQRDPRRDPRRTQSGRGSPSRDRPVRPVRQPLRDPARRDRRSPAQSAPARARAVRVRDQGPRRESTAGAVSGGKRTHNRRDRSPICPAVLWVKRLPRRPAEAVRSTWPACPLGSDRLSVRREEGGERLLQARVEHQQYLVAGLDHGVGLGHEARPFA